MGNIDVTKLSNSQLWRLILTPEESNMPENIKRLLKEAQKEFSKRDIKLVPICK